MITPDAYAERFTSVVAIDEEIALLRNNYEAMGNYPLSELFTAIRALRNRRAPPRPLARGGFMHPAVAAMHAEIARLRRRITRSPIMRRTCETRIAAVEHKIERTLAKHARRTA